MSPLKRLFLSLLCCALPYSLFAATNQSNQPAMTHSTTNDASKDADVIPISKDQSNVPDGYIRMQCPAASDLTFNSTKRLWSAKPYFKSYNTSFSKTVTQFNGAQWSGAGVGQIFCVYKGDNSMDFPILLAFNTIVAEPNKDAAKNRWTDNLKGHRNCISQETDQCTFLVKKPSQQTTIGDTLNDLTPTDKSKSH